MGSKKSFFSIDNKVECFFAINIASFTILYLFYGKSVICLLSIAIGFFSMKPYEQYLIKKDMALLRMQFRDLLYSLSASIGAGYHMKSALEEAVKNLKILYDEDTPMIMEIKKIILEMETSKGREEDIVLAFANKCNISDIQSFFNIYYISRDIGGNLISVIRKSGDILLDKMTIERDIECYTAQKRFEGRLITAMPLIVLLFLNVFSGDYLAPLYESLKGNIVMTVTLTLTIISFTMTEKIMDIYKSTGSIKEELPDFINSLVLLLNAGLVITDAFDIVISKRHDKTGVFYDRLREINRNTKLSNSCFSLEFRKYAIETGERELLRISNIINDNIDKGSELIEKLEKESEIMWHMMKKSIEEKGKIAESKLSFPMGIMMLALIMVTTAPAIMAI